MAQHPPRAVPHRKRFFQWVPTDEEQLQEAEARMLEPIKGMFVQKNVETINTLISLPIPCDRDGAAWCQGEETATEGVAVPLVLLHGFAGGVGVWVPNWEAFARRGPTFAIDLPGFGRSKRDRQSFATPESVISFYVKKLDDWFSALNLSSVDLVGHSFGAYLAAHYAIQRPERIRHLILADPWGVPPRVDFDVPLRFRLLRCCFYCANPLTPLRVAGPWGPGILPSVRKDFVDRWKPILEDPNVFYDYTFHCNAQPQPTGEQAFQACCHGNVYAKVPLLSCVPANLSRSVQLDVIFGESTWMDVEAGSNMLKAFYTTEAGEPRNEHATGPFLHTVPNAGHQLNSDNPQVFNRIVLAVIDRR